MAATSNPVLTSFNAPTRSGVARHTSPEQMTHPGILNKTAVLLAIFTLGSVFMWTRIKPYEFSTSSHFRQVAIAVFCAGLAAAGLLWATLYNRTFAPLTAPTYALLQGVVVGFLTTMPEGRNSGITAHTVCFTIAMCLCLLAAHRFRFIRVTDSFKKKLAVAVSGVLLYLGVSLGLMRVGVHTPVMSVDWLAGILFGVITAAIAGLSLVYDFDSAVQYSEDKFPKYMEWYAALGLVLTMVWLYIEAVWISRNARGGAK